MKTCPFCKEQIQDEAIKCKHCSSSLTQTETQQVNPKKPNCKLCGSEMYKSKESKSQGMGCLLAVIAIFLLFIFPIGTMIGVLLIIYSLYLGSRQRGLWVCKNCGYQAERQLKWYELG